MSRVWSWLGEKAADVIATVVQTLIAFVILWFLAQAFGPTITLTTSKGAVIISTE